MKQQSALMQHLYIIAKFLWKPIIESERTRRITRPL
jgi:hypothetical protein